MLRDIILVYLLGVYLDDVVKAEREVFFDSPDGGVDIPVILSGEVVMPVGNQSSDTALPDASVTQTADPTNTSDAIRTPGTTLSPADPLEPRQTDTTTSSLTLTGITRPAVDPIEPRPTDTTSSLTLIGRPVDNDRPQTTTMENPDDTSIPLADVCLWYFNDSYTGNAYVFRMYLNVTSEACESYVSACSGICAGDIQCIIYNDCCIDAIDQYVDTKAVIHNDFSSFRHTPLLYAQLVKTEYNYQAQIHIRTHSGCVGNKYNSMSYWMINKCPTNSNTSTVIIQKCENETQFSVSRVPVYYIDRNGVALTYQNIFCATCHEVNVNTDKLYTWSVHYKCGENIIVDASTELQTIEDKCRIQYTYPKGDYRQQLRPCSEYKYNLVSVPEATEDNLAQEPDEITEPNDVYLNSLKYLCRVYIYPLDINGTIYRNPHCAAYATIEHQKNHTMFFKISSEICIGALRKGEEPGQIETGAPDLKSLFDFDSEHGYTVRRTCEQTCKIHQIADCVLDVCRDLFCPGKTVPQYSYCVLANTSGTEPVSYTFHLPLDDSIKTADSVIYDLHYSSAAEDVTVEKLEHYITDVFTIMEYVGSVEMVEVNASMSEDNVHTVYYSVYVTIVYRHEKHPLELAYNSAYQELLRHLRLDNMTLLSIYMRNYISVSRLSCLQGIMEAERYQEFSMENVAVLFDFTGTFIPAEDTRWSKTLLDEGDAATATHIVDLAISCFVEDTNDDIPTYLNCSIIAYDRDEFTIVDNVLHVINSSLRYNKGEFIEYDGKAFVCDNKVREMNEHVFMFFTYSKSHKIIAVVTSAISMVALLAIIAVHVFVSKLRNGHGLNITALSVTMFLMQAVMLIDIKRGGPICIMFGICLHFLLLKMFVWMNIIGFDMARIFYTTFATAHGNVMNRFIKYLSFAFGIPFVVVLICFGLDYSDVSIRPKYGDGDLCYITNYIAVAAFVIGPVTFSILVNFTMFAVSVYSIQKAKRATKHVRNSSDRAYCLVYFKMTVILGFTWIMGIVAALVKVEAIWYVHTVLNGLQGVSIFVCFVLNARVLKAVSETSKLYTESSTFTSRVSCTESKVCNSLRGGTTTGHTTTSPNGV